MKVKRRVTSNWSRVRKTMTILDDGLGAEFSLIDNDTGKHIVCVPTQTSCRMGCKFCHASDICGVVPCRNLTGDEIAEGVGHALSEIGEAPCIKPWRKVLVSFMGCGEPFDNIDGVINAILKMCFDQSWGHAVNTDIRFAISTMMPKDSADAIFELHRRVTELGVNLKIHFSLHYTTDEIRKEYMPAAKDIDSSISLLKTFSIISKAPIEVHYSLMAGTNDSDEDAERLVELLSGTGFSIKFLNFNSKDGFDAEGSSQETVDMFVARMEEAGITCETYTPPGRDIGSSCGQLDTGFYVHSAKAMTDANIMAKSLCDYISDNPELRFWQAVRNWSGHGFIYVSEDLVENESLKDTFYMENK